jgi:hypothetical protein
MSQLIDGRAISAQIHSETAARVAELAQVIAEAIAEVAPEAVEP